MSNRLWVLTTIVVAAAVGIAVFIVQQYINPPYQPPAKIETVPAEDNSCWIQCPAATPYAASSGSMICTTGLAPLCQCTDAQKPQASCVPIN